MLTYVKSPIMTMFTDYRVVLLFMTYMENCVHIMSDNYCLTHRSCNTLNKDLLFPAPCIRNVDYSKIYCDTKVLSGYYNYLTCTPEDCTPTEKDHCESSPCVNNGQCLPMFGSYSCSCPDTYHGMNCERQLDMAMKTVKGVYFIFYKQTTIRKTNLVWIFVDNPGDDMRVVISLSNSGEVIEKHANNMTMVNGREECKTKKLTDIQCMHLPDKQMLYATEYFENVYTMDGDVIKENYPYETYLTPTLTINHIFVKVYNKKLEEFSYVFDQLVDFKQEVCAVQVMITQTCGISSDKPLKISRKTEKVISSILKKSDQTQKECQNQMLQYRWDIFEISSKPWTPFLEPDQSVSGSSEYNIKKFTLPFGLYKLKLTVDVSGIQKTFLSQYNPEKYSTDYSGNCFFEIMKLPLEVKIEGGSFRTVSKEDRFVLDASRSYDPNFPQDQQPHLQWKWECNNTIHFCKARLFTTGIYEFPKGLPEGVFYFFLSFETTDGSNSPVSSRQTIVSSAIRQAQIAISCLKNCGHAGFRINYKEVIYLKAVVTNNIKLKDFLWTFYKDKSYNNVKKGVDISQNNDVSDIIIIKKNILQPGTAYTFMVSSSDKTIQGRASITIFTGKAPEGGTCRVQPEEGQVVKTEFIISCSNFTTGYGDGQLSYEFYEKSNKEEQLGSMLGYSTAGELNNVTLTQENIMVRIASDYGLYTDVYISVTLHSWQPNSQDIDNLISTIKTTILDGDDAKSVRLTSGIMKVLGNVTNNLIVVNQVLESLRKDNYIDFSHVKLFTSALKQIVTRGVPQLEKGIDGTVVQSIGAMMESLSRATLNAIAGIDKNEANVIAEHIQTITSTMLDCTDVITNSNDSAIFDPSSSNRATLASHNNYKSGTANMIAALYWAGVAMLDNLLPHEKEMFIKAKDSTMWLKVENPKVLANMSSIPQNSSTNIKISEQLGEVLHKLSENVALMVVTFKQNPYWWDMKERDSASEIISVTIWSGLRRNRMVNTIPEPINVYFKLIKTAVQTVSGQVTMPRELDSEYDKDTSIAVHILEAPAQNSNGKLIVEFINLQGTELRVLILENLRPDYQMMVKNAKLVSENFASLSLTYENISADTLHFIGVLPTVKTGEKQVIDYNFNTYSVQCKLRQPTVWTSLPCTVGPETTKDKMHCQCFHMSFFGSSIFVAPNSINPIEDAKLLMTVTDNHLVVTIIMSLLITYFLLLGLLKWIEKKDKLKRSVIILEDNFPGDSYPYLVVVYTALDTGSATASNVGIKLYGTKKLSRAHVLRSRDRKVFRRNADDWFLLFSPTHLGDLKYVHLWHDNKGSSPDWYCKKVHIYDMTSQRQYIFNVNQWLSVRPGEYPEAFIQTQGPLDPYNFLDIVVHSLAYHFRENYIWLSAFMSHPRATLDKSQRLVIITSVIFVSFLTGIMFYGAAIDVPEDEPSYNIRIREIVVSMESTIISSVVGYIVSKCFKKSTSIIQNQSVTNIDLTPPSENVNVNERKRRTIVDLLSKVFRSVAEAKPMMPVLFGVETSKSIRIRRMWAIAGWIVSQCVILASTYLIILYGLKMGKVKSELWITTAFLRIGNGVLVNSPLILIISSIILATLGEMYKIEMLEYDMFANTSRDTIGDENILGKILAMRRSPQYRPLTQLKVRELRKLYMKQNLFDKIEFTITILYFLFLMSYTGNLWGESRFYINSHLSSTLTESFRSHQVDLKDADDIVKLTDHLVNTWLPNIFKSRWYNKRAQLTSEEESNPETGWYMDSTHRMIGIPIIRQSRVIYEYCPRSNYDELTYEWAPICFPSFENETTDIYSYGLKWEPVNKYVNEPILKPWSYQEPLDNTNVYGVSNTPYPNGGYIADLEDTQRASVSTISDLKNLNWFDIRLRALISDVRLINVNTKSYSSVVIISEHLPTGAVSNKIQVITITLEFNYVYFFFFVCILLFFHIRLIMDLYRSRMVVRGSTFWTYYDIIVITISDICASLYFLTTFKTITVIDSFPHEAGGRFLRFSDIIFYQRMLEILWAFLLFLAPIRLLKFSAIISFCKSTLKTFYTGRKILATAVVVVVTAISVQILIVNFAISPSSHLFNIDSYFHRRRNSLLYLSNSKYKLVLISLILGVTCCCSLILIQTILVRMYKIRK